jgi:hypothetical protein
MYILVQKNVDTIRRSPSELARAVTLLNVIQETASSSVSQSTGGVGGNSRGVPQYHYGDFKTVTIAERSKTCTVFARSEPGIVGSNLTQDMDVQCLCLCTDRGLATS